MFAAMAQRSDVELVAAIFPDGQLHLIENEHESPHDHWELDAPTWCGLLDQAAAFVHSHPSGNAWPSEADQAAQLGAGVPFVIAPRDGVPFGWGYAETPRLLGRPFRFGVTDCYALVRDALLGLYGITAGDYPRGRGFWRWDDKTPPRDLFAAHLEREGWTIESDDLADAREGDVLLFRAHADVANHCALYLGDGLMIHQPGGLHGYDPHRISSMAPVARWHELPVQVARYAP